MRNHSEQIPIFKLLDEGSLEFNGAKIHLLNVVYSVSQSFHINKLKTLSESGTINTYEFTSQREREAYIASISRPDLTAVFAVLV